jgi:hypothetical protein
MFEKFHTMYQKKMIPTLLKKDSHKYKQENEYLLKMNMNKKQHRLHLINYYLV